SQTRNRLPLRRIRTATISDATACAAIYAPYVLETAISFETVPPTAAEIGSRIESSNARHAWVVLVEQVSQNGGVVEENRLGDVADSEEREEIIRGYAYAVPYASRQAYDWSCEISVYLDRDYARLHPRSGAGQALYEALFDRLEKRGFRMLVATITLPNEASLGLHRSKMGFEDVGTFRRIGFKHGKWWDVARLQKALG
ncbi:acyl-CoA N-acyltransferase, partial [Dendrothele bispora CBS 962.96]